MVRWLAKRRYGPIGVDVGSRSVKLVQFDADHSRVLEAARWDLAPADNTDPDDRAGRVAEAIRQAREGRNFRGRDAVFSIGSQNLFVQNIRVPQVTGEEFSRVVCAEAAGRVPFAGDEAEVRYIEAANVRQGDVVRREVILLACHRPVLQRILATAESAALKPVAIDVEPNAMLRCYSKQFRRDEDQQQRAMFVNVGASTTTVVIARGSHAMFMKYIDVGGRHLDDAVARHLKMKHGEAAALRRHNGDRRADQRDPEIARSITESIRPVLDRLANELSMCIRYYSVTFRGQPLERVVLGGGEAGETLVEWLASRLDVSCELGDPLRSYGKPPQGHRIGQWDVAAGLALRKVG
ncbi:MAG TPA: pilus assembly protein PilM [Thermoguttaceae bacterium]|nr:pilus assembly protein PilM [Thermoguttaceae bacterium]